MFWGWGATLGIPAVDYYMIPRPLWSFAWCRITHLASNFEEDFQLRSDIETERESEGNISYLVDGVNAEDEGEEEEGGRRLDGSEVLVDAAVGRRKIQVHLIYCMVDVMNAMSWSLLSLLLPLSLNATQKTFQLSPLNHPSSSPKPSSQNKQSF
jgi:hypothetical protein